MSQGLSTNFIDDTENSVDEMAFRLFNSLSSEIYMIDARDYSLIRANKGALRACEYEQSDLQERPFWDLAPELTASRCPGLFSPLIKGEREFIEMETVLRRKNGSVYPVSMKLQYFDDLCPPVIVAAAQDETEKKKVEDLNIRLARIFETSLNEIYIFDGETYQFVHVNKGARRNLGYSMEEMKKLTAWAIKPEVDESQFRSLVQPLINREKETLQFETIHRRKDGTRYPVEVHLQLFTDEAPPIFVAIILDISERNEAESKISRSERNLSDAQRLAHIGSWHWDLRRDDLEWSDEMCRIFGYEPNTIETTSEFFFNSVHPDDLALVDNCVKQTLDKGTPYSVQHRIVLPNEEVRWVHERAEVIFDECGDPASLLGTAMDITERKEVEATVLKLNQDLESRVERRTIELNKTNLELTYTLENLKLTQGQLVDSEKMASLGGLVAGIAHEINTPVGIGVTAISHLKEEGSKLEKSYLNGSMKRSDLELYIKESGEAVRMVESNLQRASDLIRSFKNVAVDQMSEEPRDFELASYLEEILLSLNPKIRQKNHRIELDCDPSIRLFGQPGIFSQIITNLVMNSLIHAFEGGENGHMSVSAHQVGSDVELCYRDFGKGIPKDQVSKVFDPFFTTRRGQGGSGLGLHIIYNLITQKLGGTITCESEVGQGACFTIKFKAS